MSQRCETKVSVSSTNMISIFAGKDVVHPYRFQQNVRFEIPFTEYVSFVKQMVDLDVQGVLHFKLERYVDSLKHNKLDILRKYYLIDLSIAIQNEIALSNAYGYQATKITHNFDDLNIADKTIEDMIVILSTFEKDVTMQVREYLQSSSPRKFEYRQLSHHNKVLYMYAIYLWATAKTSQVCNYINLI